jgi:hypothetical protein
LHSHDSSYASFKRIQTLEEQLAGAKEELSSIRQGQQPAAFPDDVVLEKQGQRCDDPGQLQIPWVFNGSYSSLQDAADYTGNPQNNTVDSLVGSYPEVAALGFDGPPTMRNAELNFDIGMALEPSPHEPSIENIAQAVGWAKALSSAGDIAAGPTSWSDRQENSVQPPDDRMGRRMIEVYCDKIHPRYPFLNQSELYCLHAQRYDSVPSNQAGRFNRFKLYIVYAIGATLLKFIESYPKTPAEGYFTVALRNVSVVRGSHTLDSIEEMTLLALYSLRSPTNAGIWYMIGLAMRTCIDLGLHLESSYTEGSPYGNQRKRRLFWSVYLLERFISLALRRPFSIAEHDIETRIPSETEHVSKDQGIEEDNAMGSSAPKSSTQERFWVKLIQIKRFQSRIQTEVYCLSETRQQRSAKMEPLLTSLDAWRLSLPPLAQSENSYLELVWSMAVSQLIRPFLSMMHNDNPLISRCLEAASQVCNIFKQMHQQEAYGYSFISAHSTFIGGVTVWHVLSLPLPKRWTVTNLQL